MKNMKLTIALLCTVACAGKLLGSEIHVAAKHGRYSRLKGLLKKGVNPNELDENGNTALHQALAGMGDKKAAAKLLIDNGANVNAKNNDGNTALHLASKISTADFLLDNKADANIQNDAGVTPLHVAVVRGRTRLVSRLIAAGAQVDVADNNGTTPLHLATAISYLKSKRALTSPLDPAITRAGIYKSIANVTSIIGLGGIAAAVYNLTREGAPAAIEETTKQAAQRR